MVHKSLAKSEQDGPRDEVSTIVELFFQAMQDGEADGISPEILRDVGILFLIDGRDTTAETLLWLLLIVSKHPRVEKLRAELWRNVPELVEGKTRTLSMGQAQTLTYLEATIKETLRLYPPVPLNSRQVIDGTLVPKGCIVSLSTYAKRRLQSVWGDDVLEFKPERFLDEATSKLALVSLFEFFSFHAGPRICIGMNLALVELKLVLATLLSRYRLDVAPNEGSYRFSASLPLENSLLARIRPAKASSH